MPNQTDERSDALRGRAEPGLAGTGKSGLPHFVIIGASKCGTTAIARYLQRHPRIALSKIKEPQFFNLEENYSRGLDWYRSQFAESGEGQLRGEATTAYTYWPHIPDVPQRMSSVIPDAKLIYAMRHPVDRAFSHYTEVMKLGITMTFEETIEQHPEVVDASRYVSQINRFLRFYPRDRFLFVLSQDLRERPAEVMGQVLDFLGVEQRDLVSEGEFVVNTRGAHFARHELNRKFRSFGRRPVVSTLKKVFPKKLRTWLWFLLIDSRYGDRLRASFKPPKMLPATRARLLDEYRDETRELEDLLGRRLPDWFE